MFSPFAKVLLFLLTLHSFYFTLICLSINLSYMFCYFIVCRFVGSVALKVDSTGFNFSDHVLFFYPLYVSILVTLFV